MMGEMPKFWTCFEGRGFANGFYMDYKRENKLITRLWPYYQEKKNGVATNWEKEKMEVEVQIWKR